MGERGQHPGQKRVRANRRIKTKSFTVEEKVSSLGLPIREEGGVLRQEAVGARLVVFSIMIRSVPIYVDWKIEDVISCVRIPGSKQYLKISDVRY